MRGAGARWERLRAGRLAAGTAPDKIVRQSGTIPAMTPQTPPGVRARLAAGEQLVGLFMQLSDPAAHEFVGRLGYDLLCIEGEHSGIGAETIQRLAAASELTPTPAIARVAGNDPIAIAQALDGGVQGVLVPRVNSGAEAEAAVRAARFPPTGERGLGPARATGYGADIPSYFARANGELLLALQVETGEAVRRLDELLAVDGVDLLFVGPGDLGASLGIADPASPELRATVADVLERTRAAGRLTGVFAASAADAARWRAAGVDLVILGSDLMWLARGVAATLADLDAAAGR